MFECGSSLKSHRIPPLENFWRFIFSCYVLIVIHTCLGTPCMPDVYEGQKRALDALGLEFRIVVNCHVNAGHGTQNLCKGLKCFRLLSQLICPQEFPFDIYGQKSRVDAVYIFLLALNFWKISVHRHLLWGAEAALRLTDELEAVLCIYIALRAKK